jgi:hypothetical protein
MGRLQLGASDAGLRAASWRRRFSLPVSIEAIGIRMIPRVRTTRGSNRTRGRRGGSRGGRGQLGKRDMRDLTLLLLVPLCPLSPFLLVSKHFGRVFLFLVLRLVFGEERHELRRRTLSKTGRPAESLVSPPTVESRSA